MLNVQWGGRRSSLHVSGCRPPLELARPQPALRRAFVSPVRLSLARSLSLSDFKPQRELHLVEDEERKGRRVVQPLIMLEAAEQHQEEAAFSVTPTHTSTLTHPAGNRTYPSAWLLRAR